MSAGSAQHRQAFFLVSYDDSRRFHVACEAARFVNEEEVRVRQQPEWRRLGLLNPERLETVQCINKNQTGCELLVWA